jgi:hypothetical protein
LIVATSGRELPFASRQPQLVVREPYTPRGKEDTLVPRDHQARPARHHHEQDGRSSRDDPNAPSRSATKSSSAYPTPPAKLLGLRKT